MYTDAAARLCASEAHGRQAKTPGTPDPRAGGQSAIELPEERGLAARTRRTAAGASSEEVRLFHDPEELFLVHLPIASRSASSIISWSSSSVIRSPSSLATRFRFLKEIFPVSSSSKSRNAFRISSPM